MVHLWVWFEYHSPTPTKRPIAVNSLAVLVLVQNWFIISCSVVICTDSLPDEERVVTNVNAEDGVGRISPHQKQRRGGSLITRREKDREEKREKSRDFLTPGLPLGYRDRSVSDPRISPLKDGPLKPLNTYAHYPGKKAPDSHACIHACACESCRCCSLSKIHLLYYLILLPSEAQPHSPKQMHHGPSVLPQMAFQRTSSAGVRSSVEGSPLSPKISLPEFCQYDSGKESMTSDASGCSTNSTTLMGSARDQNRQESLIDFNKPLTALPANSLLQELDPLASMPTHKRQDSGPTHSVDSLFSDATCSFNSTMSTSPEAPSLTQTSSRHPMASATSPRQSLSLLDGTGNSPIIGRPRPRPICHTPLGHTMSQEGLNLSGMGVGFTSSAPTSRPPSPPFNQVSPTGSVQSLPQYPTYATNDIYAGFTSDSSATSSLLDLSPTAMNSGIWTDFVEKPLPPPLLSYLQQ